MALALPRRREPLWRRLLNLVMNAEPDPYARPPMAQPGVGIGVGEENLFQQGLPQGAVLYRFGTAASVVRDMPGWYVADGTQPALLIDGVSYGSPNLTQRFIIGADGTAGFTIGATGGTASHVHPFTHESAHAITQPVFDAPAAHVITQPVVGNHDALGTHTHMVPFAKEANGTGTLYLIASSNFGTEASGINSESVIAYAATSAGPLSLMLTSARSAGTPSAHTLTTNVALTNNHATPNRSVDVALTNNAPHAGGSVDAATGANKYPPYMAVWPILRVYA